MDRQEKKRKRQKGREEAGRHTRNSSRHTEHKAGSRKQKETAKKEQQVGASMQRSQETKAIKCIEGTTASQQQQDIQTEHTRMQGRDKMQAKGKTQSDAIRQSAGTIKATIQQEVADIQTPRHNIARLATRHAGERRRGRKRTSGSVAIRGISEEQG